MPREGQNTLKIRTGDYTWADERRTRMKDQTGLTLEWGDAIERGINALYDVYVNDGNHTLLSLDEIREIIDTDPRGDGDYTNVTIPVENYDPAYTKKRELEDEWGLDLTWADVLLVGVEEILAQVTPAPQHENVEA